VPFDGVPPVAEKASVMERILLRDRVLVIISLAVLSVLSWVYLAVLAMDMAEGDMSLMGQNIAAGSMVAMTATMNVWPLSTFFLMLIMWWVMMVGMMVPSAAPMILLFALVTRKQAEAENPGKRIAIFAATYIVVWGGFSVVATLAQWALTEAALLSPKMVASSQWLTIGLLAACAIYQLTPLKQACLGKCRSPLSFLMTNWHPGDLGAMKMGLSHGAYCLGCCWLLMALLFVGGVMNLFWVALIAVLVLAEKVLPHGNLLGKLGGLLMLGLAAYILPESLFV
jgi:predicted metal-binding membrane protein